MNPEKVNALIVDDEKNGRENLRHLLMKYCPEIGEISTADSVKSAKLIIKNALPSLVFLDIEMPHENGFSLLDSQQTINFETIFVTAYSNYAIKAFKYSAVDYLLKPIVISDLQEAVRRAKHRITIQDFANTKEILNNLKEENKISKIALPTSNGRVFVEFNEIIRCESESNYTRIYLQNGAKILVSKTLKEYDELLTDAHFYRVHQSHLISLKHIRSHEKNNPFIMSDGSSVPISQRKKDLAREIVGKLAR